MKRQDVLDKLKGARKDLNRFHVASLSVFGSVARDEAANTSDVDLLVEFSTPIGLFDFVRLKRRLEEILGCSVDLGTPDSLKDRIREKVLEEAVRVA